MGVALFDFSEFSFKGPGVEASGKTRPQEVVEAEVSLATALQAASSPKKPVTVELGPRQARGRGDPGEAGRQAAEARKRALRSAPAEQPEVEALMRAAAHWGWLQARSGVYQEEPVPYIRWSTDGKPQILLRNGWTDRACASQRPGDAVAMTCDQHVITASHLARMTSLSERETACPRGDLNPHSP